MKKILISMFALLIGLTSIAQDPVSLEYKAVKLFSRAEKGIGARYEIHITANIQDGWHMYAQNQPDDAIAIPTTITFIKNPLIKLEGKPIEIGNLEKKTDAAVGISAWQYAGKVDFVQYINLKSRVKTVIKGTIEYQVCTDEKCLPPKTISFNVKLM